MEYISTRDPTATPASFEHVLLTGLPPDNGLYIPTSIPKLSIESLAGLKYTDLCIQIIKHFIPIPIEDLTSIVEKAYSSFRHEDVISLHSTKDLTIVELFNGPTYAFKDVAMQLLGELFTYFLKKRDEKLVVVGATSGDTGSAAIYALRNKPNIELFILHPLNKISPIQEAQMTTILDDNIHNIAVKGSFDDCQNSVKSILNDKEMRNKYNLASVNSINWARILAQIVYYFYTYDKLQKPLTVAVPTGNFGDILAGYFAKQMGLPIEKLIVSTNANDILTRFWQTGIYGKHTAPTKTISLPEDGSKAHEDGVKETLSPAMDILVSSNFERLLYYLAKEDAPSANPAATVKSWMDTFKSSGTVQVPPSVLKLAQRDFAAEMVSDEQTIEIIRQYYKDDNKYVLDPHTAIGVGAAKRQGGNVSLATAHPGKFGGAVDLALKNEVEGYDFEKDVLPEEFRRFQGAPRRKIIVDDTNVESIKKVIDEKLGN